MQFINLLSADKSNLISLVDSLLVKIVGTIDYRRVDELLKSFSDVFFLLETPYIDEHYRDSYYFYYAEKFLKYERNSIRVHIFNERVNENNFAEKKDSYLGYFVIRPLKMYPLGHSFISPKAFKEKSFLCCLTKNKINILGNRFKVFAFPHVVQDTETQTCAESSLWSLLSYFGTRYNEYRPYKSSEIIEKLNSFAGHRTLPSKGLLLEELTACLNSCGQNCIIYCLNHDDKNSVKSNFSLMRIYVESGMPFVVALKNKNAAHAVLAIGHEEIDSNDVLECQKKLGKIWIDVSEFDKKLVFVDDNFTPYTLDSCERPAARYNNSLSDMQISAFVVPVQKHMFMDAQTAFSLISKTFNDSNFGLKTFGAAWITRLLLTTGTSFKNSLKDDTFMDGNLKKYLMLMSLPKFIWISEIYSTESYAANKCVGIIIIDSTGNKKSLDSVLFYCVNDMLMNTNGLSWIGKRKIVSFSKETYRNNLKGAWNKWQI